MSGSVIFDLVTEEERVRTETIPALQDAKKRKDRAAEQARTAAVHAWAELDRAEKRAAKLAEAIVVLAEAEGLDLKVIEVWRRNLRGEGSIEELRKKVGV